MTAVGEAPATTQINDDPGSSTDWARRPLSAGLVLFTVYLVLSLFIDPLVGLSTDTGGKTATLEAMSQRGDLDPDIGYWAERFDPDGSVHPMWFTVQTDDGWLQVTTLPLVYAARPLYELGGTPLARLLPMAGAVAAAFAARSLARRLRPDDDGWAAYWLVGVASPVAVYALDFWEHSIGVALMSWGVIAALDAVERRRWLLVGAAGFAFGAAATMRTESVVYAVVTVGVACVAMAARRDLGDAVRGGLAAIGAWVIPVVLNAQLEAMTIGDSYRLDRAESASSRFAADLSVRTKEALVTTIGLRPSIQTSALLLGACLVGLLVLVGRADRGTDGSRLRILVAGVAALYVVRFSDGLGFVPGLLAATPLAAVGLVRGVRGSVDRFVVTVAVLALPLVFAFQYTGGAVPQWAGRYLLTSGLLLMVVGITRLPELPVPSRRLFVIAPVVVTLFGYVWFVQRSNDMADAYRTLAARDEPVLVWGNAFLAREAGELNLAERWLTAIDDESRREAASVVAAAGFDRFGYVFAASSTPEFEGWTAEGSDQIDLVSGVQLTVTTYERAYAP